MSQVSRFQLLPEVWEKIFNLFTDTFFRLKDKNKFGRFVDNFFSPTERIMLAKRLAIAVLLAKGNDYATIKRTLRVTAGTISKVGLLLRTNKSGLRFAVEEILKRDAGRLFWEEIMDLIDYKGKGRDWSEVGKSLRARGIRKSEIRKGLGIVSVR